jgi:uncharacterized membrane protein YgaE (UPF0421/DUF939 family)
MQDFTFRKNIELAVLVIGFLIAIPIVFLSLPKKGDVIIINCSISEISPDFTIEMREACRQARANNIQKDLQKPK